MKPPIQPALLYCLFFVMLLLIRPNAGFEGDVQYWVAWATHIQKFGLGNVYQLETNNYNPLYHYILWLFGKMMGTPEKIEFYRHQLKAFTLLFDFAGALLVSSLVVQRERRFVVSLLLLFNIAYVYNTLIWEQVDAIFSFFALAAVVTAVRGRTVSSVLLYVLALNAKTQAIIFLPPLLLLWGFWWLQARRRQLPVALLAGAALQTAILAPFIWWSEQNSLPRILAINQHAADIFPVLSMNAFNFWLIFDREEALKMLAGTRDTVVASGLTYRQWGMLMFAGTSAAALLPVLVLLVRKLRARRSSFTLSEQALVLLSCGLLPLLFTYFNTQMHERYWHPALLLLAAAAVLTRRYWLFALFSVSYFLQLESVLKSLGLKKYTVLLFDPYFIAGLFMLCILGGFYELYRLATRPAASPDPAQPLEAAPAVAPLRAAGQLGA